MSEPLEVGEHASHIAHQAHGAGGFAQAIAIVSSVIALLASFTGLQSETSFGHALDAKNNAILRQAEASDKWSYFQAKSTKQGMQEMAARLSTRKADREAFEAKGKKYDEEKAEIKKEAEEKEKERDEFNHESEHFLHVHHRFAPGVTLFQVGMVLAAISMVVQKRSVLGVGIVAATGGLGFLLAGFLA